MKKIEKFSKRSLLCFFAILVILPWSMALAATRGEVPSVEATEAEQGMPSFREADDGPPLRPNHPPIGQIPPMPMPHPQETDILPTSTEPMIGIFYNVVTGKTVVSPVDDIELLGGFGQGGDTTEPMEAMAPASLPRGRLTI